MVLVIGTVVPFNFTYTDIAPVPNPNIAACQFKAKTLFKHIATF
jgi:hypothetical protein